MGSIKPASTIRWSTSAFHLTLVINENGVVCLRDLTPSNSTKTSPQSRLCPDSDLPLNSVRLAGEGNTSNKTAKSLIGSYVSSRLKYESHHTSRDEEIGTERLEITSADNVSGIQVTNHFVAHKDSSVIQFSATATNISSSRIVVTQLSSLTIGGLTTSSREWYHDYTLMSATNTWFREAQWREHKLPDIGIDTNGILELADGHCGSQANFTLSKRGSFSTDAYLPMGLLKRSDGRDTWIWQVEHNGSWRWEIGDFKDSVYLSLGGPTSVDHDWAAHLEPGQTFTTVKVAVGRVSGDWQCAFQALTGYRRQIRRPHVDMDKMPIIFNDYMNCLMGDPNEEKILALLEPVADSGAKYFVIDAGWYADDSNWWDDVGLWEPSKKRFPSGFKNLLDKIRAKGLIPGLWVEPEVVGVRSEVAKSRLPDEAFFHEDGHRVIEKGRYQLDYRHPEVIEWMNSVVKRLVEEYGAGYFKFDYNIEVVQGTDVFTRSKGAAHLDHQRAYLTWVRSLLDLYPNLVIENCSSGAQRMEYGMLSVHPLQSTSDQQDPVLYAAIAAAAPTAVTPEQSCTWAYPQRDWSDEINAISMINSLLGRVHLSGRLDILKKHQLDLVREAMQVYEIIKPQIKTARPFWPLGLPRWHDKWVSLGLVSESGDDAFISVWRRGATTNDVELPLANGFKGCASVEVKLLYPASFEVDYTWKPDAAVLSVILPKRICARLFHVRKL